MNRTIATLATTALLALTSATAANAARAPIPTDNVTKVTPGYRQCTGQPTGASALKPHCRTLPFGAVRCWRLNRGWICYFYPAKIINRSPYGQHP